MKALSEEVRQAILEIQVNAALAGHDLGPFEPVEGLTGGYEAWGQITRPLLITPS